MEALVQTFLEENADKPKLIILGESHGGDNNLDTLRENAGKEITVLRTIHALGQPFLIYSELPTEFISNSPPNFTVTYLKQEAARLHVPFKTSRIGLACRTLLGSCNTLYEANITSYLNLGKVAAGAGGDKSQLVVAVLGLLHAADMQFPKEISVLRLNCTTLDNTNFALSELRKAKSKFSHNTADIIESDLPYITDEASVALGRSIVPKSAIPKLNLYGFNTIVEYTEEESSNGINENKFVGSFKPEWVKNATGNWVAKCPICKNVSGTLIQQLTHRYDCPNKGKKVDESEKPTSGGKKRRARHTRRTRRHNKKLKNFSKRNRTEKK